MVYIMKRPHLGTGVLALRRELSVFINCPFDVSFKPIFNALIFSTICCGFIPRCAIESGSASVPRMDRIVSAIKSSKYSIHDLSRCTGEGEANFARFNMPLELGMAMAQRFGRNHRLAQHDWLMLVPRGHSYKRFISDLAGFDPVEYDTDVETVIPATMAWLATRPDAVETPTPQAVLDVLPQFHDAHDSLFHDWHGQVPWTDVLITAISIGQTEGLIPRDVT
jgi:hypothetical protein